MAMARSGPELFAVYICELGGLLQNDIILFAHLIVAKTKKPIMWGVYLRNSQTKANSYWRRHKQIRRSFGLCTHRRQAGEREEEKMGGGMEVHKNRWIEEWNAGRENLEFNFRWTRRSLAVVGLFGLAVPILVYKGIVREFVRDLPVPYSLPLSKRFEV
uniref:Uncharacterized protein n=1 Tax=Oryza glaberrima TaxID=4538 RepID=I1NRF7_ORYGL